MFASTMIYQAKNANSFIQETIHILYILEKSFSLTRICLAQLDTRMLHSKPVMDVMSIASDGGKLQRSCALYRNIFTHAFL